MKKKISALLGLVVLAISGTALAAPTDVSTTSNFTVSVVEETLGLTITGQTQQEAIYTDKRWHPKYSVSIKNSGNTPGVLYATPLDPIGTTWSSMVTWYQFAWSGDPASPFDTLNKPNVEQKLTNTMDWGNNVGEKTYLEPTEEIGTSFMVFTKATLPAGEYEFPVRFTIKAN